MNGPRRQSTENTTDHCPITYNQLLEAKAVICHPCWYSRWLSGRTQLALFDLISKIHTPGPRLAQDKMESKVSLIDYLPKSRWVSSLESKLNISKKHLVARNYSSSDAYEELRACPVTKMCENILFQFRVPLAKRLHTVQLNSGVYNNSSIVQYRKWFAEYWRKGCSNQQCGAMSQGLYFDLRSLSHSRWK